MSKEQTFLGTGWSFPPKFTSHKRGVELTSDEENILGSVRTILTTKQGERIMHPFFGCDLNDDLFEPMGSTEITRIKNRIKDALLFFEPRIKDEEVTLNLNNIYEGMVEILIEFTIISTNSRTNMVFPFYKNEATDL